MEEVETTSGIGDRKESTRGTLLKQSIVHHRGLTINSRIIVQDV